MQIRTIAWIMGIEVKDAFANGCSAYARHSLDNYLKAGARGALVNMPAVRSCVDGREYGAICTYKAEKDDPRALWREQTRHRSYIGRTRACIEIHIRGRTFGSDHIGIVEEIPNNGRQIRRRNSLVTIHVSSDLRNNRSPDEKADGDADETAPEPHKFPLFPPSAR